MKYIYIIFLPALLLLTACSSPDDPDNLVGSGDCVSLSFNMMTAGTIKETRADDQGHNETDSEFREFEDGIDMGDLGILIFAKIAGSTSEHKLVYKLTNLLASDDAHINVVGSGGNYLVNLMILKDDLKEVLGGYEITPEGTSLISFRMLILANCAPAGTNATAMWDAVNGQDFPTVISQLSQWNFSMSDIYNADGGPEVKTLYSNHENNKVNHCPMFGTKLSTTTEQALYYSRPENRVYLGEVNLLRSLAKVRVVDNIQNKDDQGYPRVEAVEFLSSQSQARQLPFGALDYQDGQQVHTPNIFEENSNLTLAATYKLGTIHESWSMTPDSQRTGDVFIGFVPEQRIGHPNNNADEGMPVFHITIANHKANGYEASDDEVEMLDFYVPMTSYNGVNFNFGQDILRNHIYTLSVNDFGAQLNMEVVVVPYRSCVLEPYFGLDRDELPGIVPPQD
ncbi:MAG: hypothetical protein K2K97_07855 [Muribaculaceae bacterium]|nr:hypothetical protein [Muribaculaceae bacterium]